MSEELALQQQIDATNAAMLAAPQIGEGDTPRNRLALKLFDLKEKLYVLKHPPVPVKDPATVAAEVQQRHAQKALKAALRAELEVAPEGSPEANRAIEDILALAAADAIPERGDFGWADYSAAVTNGAGYIPASEVTRWQTTAQAAGWSPMQAVPVVAALVEPPRDQDVVYREFWGADYEEKLGYFQAALDQLPDHEQERVALAAKRRPALAEALAKLGRDLR